MLGRGGRSARWSYAVRDPGMVMPGESPDIITHVLEEAGNAATAAPHQDDAIASQEMVRISAPFIL